MGETTTTRDVPRDRRPRSSTANARDDDAVARDVSLSRALDGRA